MSLDTGKELRLLFIHDLKCLLLLCLAANALTFSLYMSVNSNCKGSHMGRGFVFGEVC